MFPSGIERSAGMRAKTTVASASSEMERVQPRTRARPEMNKASIAQNIEKRVMKSEGRPSWSCTRSWDDGIRESTADVQRARVTSRSSSVDATSGLAVAGEGCSWRNGRDITGDMAAVTEGTDEMAASKEAG